MSQKYFDKYDDNFNDESSSCCLRLCNCCTGCVGGILKHMTKQFWKLVVFLVLLGVCVAGIYWGATELKSLNSFREVSNGCMIVSLDTDLTGESCNECNCNYYYNVVEFKKRRVCDSCTSVKYRYTVKTEHCGDKLLTLDNDYWEDKACGVSLKNVGSNHTCYLYDDCRGQYSFDTMYADQDELVYPIIVICVCSVLIVVIFLVRCICF